MTKEQIYDEQIAPLMKQIIAICKEHKIANVCTFSLINDDNDGVMYCTTMNILDECDPPEKFFAIRDILYPPKIPPLMLTVRGGDGDVKSIEAIL